MSFDPRTRGFSLIEAVIFIVVMGIGFASILALYSNATRASVDPVVRKQALALASSILEEIELRGFTFCDPDDTAVFTAANEAGCTTVEGVGREGAESLATRSTLDNVSDYHGLSMAGTGIVNMAGASVSPSGGLNGYAVSVAIANIAANELPAVGDVHDALRITVTATGPAGVSVALQGYRVRYAPNSP
ncbi:MAG: prepilin-type N-terminal cleavage/methylation domain-containing protein [Burkholderiales bacterium]